MGRRRRTTYGDSSHCREREIDIFADRGLLYSTMFMCCVLSDPVAPRKRGALSLHTLYPHLKEDGIPCSLSFAPKEREAIFTICTPIFSDDWMCAYTQILLTVIVTAENKDHQLY